MNTLSIEAAQAAIICLGTTVAMGTESDEEDWQMMIKLQQMLRQKLQHSYESEENDIILELSDSEQHWFDCAMSYGILFYGVCDNIDSEYLLEIAKIVKDDDLTNQIEEYTKMWD